MNQNKRIYLASPHMSEEGYEKQYIEEAFETNFIAPLGINVNEFENELSALVGVKSAAALSSGTAAIHMALKAAGIGEGDIVFCSDLTFSASVNPVRYLNAVPVFIDADIDTWNMSPMHLEKAFDKYRQLGKQVKAVVIVHLYGLTADMDRIKTLCDKSGAVLIEDAAESLGTLYKDSYTGSIGDYGIYSFNGNKIITTSGGGMVVSDQEERIHKIKFWSSQSRDPARHYQHSELGYNYRMSNIVAGIGRGQLKVLGRRIEKKKYIFEFYKKAFWDHEDIHMMPVNDWNRPNYWLSCISLKGRLSPLEVIVALEEDEIESRPIWKPMHLQPFFAEYDYIGDGISEEIYRCGVCLPSDTKLTEEDLYRIVRIIKDL
ncbi:DegT/DnrJ/EryC1/StrS family aminotransferase [Mobilitalea sibirica]|uniref:DegT/DnrJ/EryC1/StrS family aminotransferase n=1 Tax=Mobilitalea sibirica TaxID=1462919 RepID=A0A8J7H0A2_9FIRM|nr:aminotransferase class I/II-fold pyridoxal phosphate-dependent enzyme [Mobilitalea sibirica]MBH1939405.1 DegT/DnrJ/EryC1/StrS family aminotransferase [Mobilitalea sibirica]